MIAYYFKSPTTVLFFKKNQIVLWIADNIIDNSVFIVFIFILHIPSMLLSLYRLYVIFYYLVLLLKLKLRFINEIKSPLYDRRLNRAQPGLINFFVLYTKNSMFNIFYAFFQQKRISPFEKLSNLTSFISKKWYLIVVILILPSPTLIRLIIYWSEIAWNFRYWKNRTKLDFSYKPNLSFIETLKIINSDKSTYLFYINFALTPSEKKLFLYLTQIRANGWWVTSIKSTFNPTNLRNDFIDPNMIIAICKFYSFMNCVDFQFKTDLDNSIKFKMARLAFQQNDNTTQKLYKTPHHFTAVIKDDLLFSPKSSDYLKSESGFQTLSLTSQLKPTNDFKFGLKSDQKDNFLKLDLSEKPAFSQKKLAIQQIANQFKTLTHVSHLDGKTHSSFVQMSNHSYDIIDYKDSREKFLFINKKSLENKMIFDYFLKKEIADKAGIPLSTYQDSYHPTWFNVEETKVNYIAKMAKDLVNSSEVIEAYSLKDDWNELHQLNVFKAAVHKINIELDDHTLSLLIRESKFNYCADLIRFEKFN